MIRLDTMETCYLKAANFTTRPYWEKELPEALKDGFCLAVYRQVSDYYPVRQKNKITLEDGRIVLIVPPKEISLYADSSSYEEHNPVKGIVVLRTEKGEQGYAVYFNPDDLTLTY